LIGHDISRLGGYDLKTCVGECVDDALRNLLGFFWVYAVFRVIVSAVANCLRNQRVYLMLICQDDPPFLLQVASSCFASLGNVTW
jgi:hypothetical protein